MRFVHRFKEVLLKGSWLPPPVEEIVPLQLVESKVRSFDMKPSKSVAPSAAGADGL
jgi:hypothetical protein